MNQIISFSSGMILPRTTDDTTNYNQIITSAHAMATNNINPDLEFYFVRSEALDSNTGLPKLSDIKRVLPIDEISSISSRHLIEYLRHQSNPENSNNVRRIISFAAFDNPVMQTLSTLAHHSPRYHAHQDGGYGYLEHNGFIFEEVQFANIDLLNHLLAEETYTYYALGYPNFFYFSTKDKSPLIKKMKFSPFTMTSAESSETVSPSNQHTVLGITDTHMLRHGASTAKGMSGGPILRFDETNNRIEIIGIVKSGDLNENFGVKFW